MGIEKERGGGAIIGPPIGWGAPRLRNEGWRNPVGGNGHLSRPLEPAAFPDGLPLKPRKVISTKTNQAFLHHGMMGGDELLCFHRLSGFNFAPFVFNNLLGGTFRGLFDKVWGKMSIFGNFRRWRKVKPQGGRWEYYHEGGGIAPGLHSTSSLYASA